MVPASSPSLGMRVEPPGHSTVGMSCWEARAIIVAGRPLSQLATPRTALRVGRERMSLRNTMAASLRYGSESNMPMVPWVRPSHGSETNVA